MPSSNMVCKAYSARGPIALGGGEAHTNPVCGREDPFGILAHWLQPETKAETNGQTPGHEQICEWTGGHIPLLFAVVGTHVVPNIFFGGAGVESKIVSIGCRVLKVKFT